MFPTASLLDRIEASVGRDLVAFLPELVLCGTIVAMLLLRLSERTRSVHFGVLALVATLVALAVAAAQWVGDPVLDPRTDGKPTLAAIPIFSGLLVYDAFTIYLRLFLLAFVALTLGACLLSGIPDREDSADFATLLLGATIGMLMMGAANHLLTVFLAVEMASVPSYALAGFLKGRRRGSEAALKYVVYGASASGVMLYGISLLTAKFGTGSLTDLAHGYAVLLGPSVVGTDPVVLAGTLFVAVGLGFKLAAFPFHFWCPDVFEGAAAEVAAFLSVASKGAALALCVRFLLTIGSPTTATSLAVLVALFAAATATFGNLAALGQTNLKRLLAYSTIAHAGYMLMALAPMNARGAGAVLFYLVAYLVMNLGAFAVVAFVRNRTGSEELSAYRGMIRRSPVVAVTFALFLVSLLGLPPLAGFAAKFQIFSVLLETGVDLHEGSKPGVGLNPLLAGSYFALLAVLAINTVVSAAYYLKILRVMVLDGPPEADDPPVRVGWAAAGYLTVLAGLLIALGLAWDPLSRTSQRAAGSLPSPAEVFPAADARR